MKRKLLFVHIPKTAGVSIYVDSIKNNIDIYCFGHQFANELIKGGIKKDISKKTIDCSFKNFYVFSIVRNPYDRFLSSYYFYRDAAIGTKKVKLEIKKYKTFEDFCFNFNKFKYKTDKQFIPQTKFLLDKNNNVLVDYVGRFETVNNDWKYVCETNGWQIKNDLSFENKTDHKSWQEEFTEEMKEIVYDLYSEDFIFFNYDK